MGSLRDELLKAKLVSKKEAKKAKRTQRLQNRKRDSRSPDSQNHENQATFEKEVAEKAARSRQFEAVQRQENEEKSRIFRLRDIVVNSEVQAGISGNRKFYFVNSLQRIPCMEISPQAAGDLQKGRLAIVGTPGEGKEVIRIISRSGAVKLSEEAPEYVLFFNR